MDTASSPNTIDTIPEVLLIDDDPEIRQTAGILLKLNGYCVHAAGTAEEAINLLEQYPFQVVIMDLILPDMRDTDLFGNLRAKRPDIPIIICTGLDFCRIRPELLSAPLVSYLEKPYTCSALCAAVAGALCADVKE